MRLTRLCLVCEFLCRRVTLPTCRAAVESSGRCCGLVPLRRCPGCGGERLVCFCAPPALRSLIWSRIRTELERFTCAAMLRMQTLVCAPERCRDSSLGQLPWGCIRCVRGHSASSASSVALLRLHSCNSSVGPVHVRRVRSHRRHGPGPVL